MQCVTKKSIAAYVNWNSKRRNALNGLRNILITRERKLHSVTKLHFNYFEHWYKVSVQLDGLQKGFAWNGFSVKKKPEFMQWTQNFMLNTWKTPPKNQQYAWEQLEASSKTATPSIQATIPKKHRVTNANSAILNYNNSW